MSSKNKKFIDSQDFESRKNESESVLKNYPERVPIIVEKSYHCDDICDIDKNKFLAPRDINFGQFVFSIRKRLKLPPEKAIFLFTDNIIIPNTQNIANAYEQFKKKDGFMYITYDSENTFG